MASTAIKKRIAGNDDIPIRRNKTRATQPTLHRASPPNGTIQRRNAANETKSSVPNSTTGKSTRAQSKASSTSDKVRVDAADALCSFIKPMSTGLATVVIRDKHLLRDARAAIEVQYMNFGNVADTPAPQAEFMLSLHSGAASEVDGLNALAELEKFPKTAMARTFNAYGLRRNFNFCSDEGLNTLLPVIEDAENSWVTLAQSCESLSSVHLIAGMCEIRATAEKAAAYVLLFIVGSSKDQRPGVQDFCDEYLEVEACEPDPRAHLAFSIEALRLADMHALGYGKVICNVTLTNDGYVRTFEPFIAKSLRDRFIWKLRAAGKSLAEIGELVDRHKSSVKRCLDGMRPVRRRAISDELIAQHVEALEVDDAGKGSPDHPDESEALV
ncbi:hypothetical protein SAMN05216466_122114 [Paraburkholderia phenazinium]|uniref:Uncharacterized protein n=1 Tax=Paraburkholderia phenazinium TaxID=60549 RepID=A0A1G8KF75_9BURK|nr:hypothetical protein [Paraburkholderia phenazinium]SDI42057.1 hypothetical protein SAMN05216466_122114 [Paraburkholderia phenazinium]